MNLSGKTVLLTGGTGSFGNAFARRILDEHPTTTLRVFSRDELKQSEMAGGSDDEASLHDRRRTQSGPYDPRLPGADIVVHAAAMKQVGV